jgi:hypothetical protein
MRLALAALPLLLLGACTIAVGGRPETCGTYPEGGGPAVIRMRDQELCEVVRLRVLRGLSGVAGLTQAGIDALLEKTDSWGRRSTVADLVEAIRRDAGDAFADDVARSYSAVTAQSKLPVAPECEADERCWVRGAVLGIEIALRQAQPTAAPDATSLPVGPSPSPRHGD